MSGRENEQFQPTGVRHQRPKTFSLGGGHAASERGQAVCAAARIIQWGTISPFGICHQAIRNQSMKMPVERSRFELNCAVRLGPDGLHDAVAVQVILCENKEHM
jgi:hypothetical protein